MREQVVVERVPINKIWEGPPPSQRYEADKLIIPVLEEVLVYEKRLMLKEELRISRIQNVVQEAQTVVLRTEHATVERVEASANTEDRQTPPT
jgi:stress response protein YsnF